MKIMNEYTYSHLKKNKRYSISILIAIIIASSLLCSLCIFVYSIWDGKVNTAIKRTGYWQGELAESISGDKFKYIRENPDVDTIMVKGNWVTAKLSNTKRPYLLLRDANKEFWDNMNFKDGVIEGRLPEKSGEIVVSKLFFIDNPSYKVGDEVNLPKGNRMLDNEVLDTQSYKREGETFKELGSSSYTIVGELDISGISAFPGYIAMGYLDVKDIKPKDELTVYMNFKNSRKIYDELPKVAEDVGLDKDSNGEYKLTYNTQLLNLYGISNKGDTNLQFILIAAIAIIMVTLVIGSFVLIIYNAFALSANSRIKELSILKSLGATPKQIKYSVIFEGFLLWLIQLPIGLIIGYAFSYSVLSKVNEILSITEGYSNIKVCFSYIIVLFYIITSLLTVLISAYIPARKVAKISAISGIVQNYEKIKIRKRKMLCANIFGIEGELASSQFRANKKSLRTAILSLAICFVLITSYVSIIAIYNKADSKNDSEISHDVTIDINTTDEPNEEMINKIVSMPESKDSVIKREVRTSTYVRESQESNEFSKLGGFSKVDYRFNVSKQEDEYRIIVNLVGLSDESFKKYCKDIGTDYEQYYKEGTLKGVLINETFCVNPDSNKAEKIPLLNVQNNSSLCLYEKIEDDMDVDNKFNIQIGCVTNKTPCNLGGGRYSLSLVIPMNNYKEIVKKFAPNRILESSKMTINLLVGDETSAKVKDEVSRICNSYLGSEDFNVSTLLEEKAHKELVQSAIKVAVSAVAIMIGIIGIFNTFSIVSNNMRLRKREFAMLRSVGLTPKGLNKIFTLEGMFFAFKPILISLPFIAIICYCMIRLSGIELYEFIQVIPIISILFYSLFIIAAIFSAYYISSRKVKRSNLAEDMKDEII